jgi:formyl-CoA transferase
VALPSRILWESAGTRAAMDVLAALWAVPRVGGQLVDVSVHAMAASKDDMIDRYDVGMLSWGRLAGIGLPPTGTWQCRDGFFDVACYQDSHWDSFLDMLDHPPELAEPALADMVLRQQIFDGLVPIMAELMADRSREDLMRRGQAAGLPCGLLNTPAEFVHDEQVRAREIFQPLTKPGVGTVELPGPGFRTDPPLHRQAGPAPTLGQHTEEFVVGELGCKPEALTEWKESGVV